MLAKKFFYLYLSQWLGFFALILAGFILEKAVKYYISRMLIRLGKYKKTQKLSDELSKRFVPSLRVVIIALIWNIGIPLLEIDSSSLPWFSRVGKFLFTCGIVMSLYQAVDLLSLYFQRKAELSENKFDDILVPLIRKSAKTFVVAIGIIAIGDSLTINVKGILAGMGIIGLGLSLAAKDTLSNLFGSLTVLLDRPFHIGDWVMIDKNIEGIVEEVGLRSCRIRTFYDSLVTMPNGSLVNTPIDNFGQRKFRRLSTTISLQYDTPADKIDAFCAQVRQLILNHPHTRKDYFHVYLNEMATSSLDVMLYVFFKVPDWSQELKARHTLLRDIIKVGNDMGVELAFPTRTVHLKHDSHPTSP